MSRRGRALAFVALAVACAVGSASLAAGSRGGETGYYGELAKVVVTTQPLASGSMLGARQLSRAVEMREVPVRFVPPDALHSSGQAEGARLSSDVPPGSYLLSAHLDRGSSARAAPGAGVPPDLVPIDVAVSAAGAIARLGPTARVDVVTARQPRPGGRARVEIVAAGVRLLRLSRQRNELPDGGPRWLASLALPRPAALKVIEAESSAAEIRLIPR